MKNILVFFGGKSVEHDVSVITGVLTLNSIDKSLFVPIPVYVDKNGKFLSGNELFDIGFYKQNNFKKLKKVTLISGDNNLYEIKKNKLKKLYSISCAISCMHGLNGEDGSIIGLLKTCQIPFASPDLYVSSFGIDKDYTKQVLAGINVDKLPYVRIFRNAYFEKKETAIKMVERKFSYPVIIKPACLGSSIGITVANDSSELKKGLDLAFIYDDKVIVERKLENIKEINCAAYKCQDKIIISKCEEPIKSKDILSFKDKYLGYKGGNAKNVNLDIDKVLESKIKTITEKIYRKCDVIGVIRIDYIISDNKIYVNEINTVPGSLAYYLFSDTVSGFSNMLTQIIKEGISKQIAYNARCFEYSSKVLDGLGSKSGKIKTIDKKNN